MPAAIAALLVVVAAATGVGVGHAVWPTSNQQSTGVVASRSNASAPNSGTESGPITTSPGRLGSGSSGSGNSGGSGVVPGPGGSNGSSGSGGSNGTNGANGSSGTSGSNGNGSNGSGEPGGGGSGSGLPGNGGLGNGGLNNGGLGNGGLGNGLGNGGQGSAAQPKTSTGSAALDKVVAGVDGALVDIYGQFSYQGAEGAGTGIVLTSTGEILTNNHVIDGATALSVVDIGNGKTYDATVVGYDLTDDIAVLQLKNASGLKTATIGDSSKLAVGNTVVGIGNAGGAGGTPSVAAGAVTALNKSITVSDELYGTSTSLGGLIEVNADIQSGDSGGSLINASGQVVGVDTAASAGSSMNGSADGYAVPIDTAMTIVKQVDSGTGTATVHVGSTAALGVLVASASSGTGRGRFGGSGQAATSGAPVEGVVTGGSAEQAGLVAGDVITSVDSHTVTSSADLSAVMLTEHPGQTVDLGWTDASGQAHTATVTLGTGPAA